MDESFMQWITDVYASNQFEQNKKLWKDIGRVGANQHGSLIVLGDLNNVLGFQDRIGGTEVREAKFIYLWDMMESSRLFEMDCKGDKFTWYNKHSEGAIYSCSDKVIGTWNGYRRKKDKFVYIMKP